LEIIKITTKIRVKNVGDEQLLNNSGLPGPPLRNGAKIVKTEAIWGRKTGHLEIQQRFMRKNISFFASSRKYFNFFAPLGEIQFFAPFGEKFSDFCPFWRKIFRFLLR
jgi:hypothetical protein